VTDSSGVRRRGAGDAGGASLVVLALIVVVVQVMSVGAGTVGRAIVDRNRAQIAADAVALAGVVDVDIAERVAQANSATITSFVVHGGSLDRTVDVTVTVGRASGAARATLAP
jgi:hypothetical protein